MISACCAAVGLAVAAHLCNEVHVGRQAAKPIERPQQLDAQPALMPIHLTAQEFIAAEVLGREVIVDLIENQLGQANHVHTLRWRPVRRLRRLNVLRGHHGLR